MKFIHIADIHWGMTPDSDRPWSRERGHAIRDTFGEIVKQARIRDVDCLFIAGDLFHRQPLLRDLKGGQLSILHHPWRAGRSDRRQS